MTDDATRKVLDWKLKLMQILACVGEEEGTIFHRAWHRYGVSDAERDAILAALDEYDAGRVIAPEANP